MSKKQAKQHHSFSSNFKNISSISRWMVWFVILCAVCGLISAAFFMETLRVDVTMCGTILVLASGLIVKGFLDAMFLERETNLASKQTVILEHVDNFKEFLDRSEYSMFRAHIENLYIISRSQSDISQDNLIEILHNRLMARNRVMELFSSVLITLGLIGTILELIIMMDSLSAVMADFGNSNELLERIADPETGPLGGLGVAFYTTLIGSVFGGIVLRVLTGVFDSNVMVYTSHIAELTEVYVLPHLRKVAREEQAKQTHPATQTDTQPSDE